jgi:RHS repeat-associated protein
MQDINPLTNKNKRPMLIRIVFTVLSFMFLSFSSSAVLLPRTRGLLTTPNSGTPVITIGTAGASMLTKVTPPSTGLGFVDINKQGAITLGVNHHHKIFVSLQSVTEITVKVKRYAVVANYPLTQMGVDTTITLRVSYYPTDSLNFDDKHTITFSSEELYTAEIMTIKVNGVVQTTLPVNLYLQGDLFIDRIYNFTTQATVTPTFVSAATAQDLNCDLVMDQLTIAWNPIIGAEEYQLEWVYINDIEKNSSNVFVDFKVNSTRISTSATSYALSLIFDKGYVCYRVRAVGRSIAVGYQNRFIFTKWTTLDGSVAVGSLPPNSSYHITVPFQISKNWQYSSTYAEEGKKKEVVSFFDGSLRNRQMVTKVNSDKNAIVGETIYDHMGRPAVQVLPTPVIDPTSCSDPNTQATLKYYPEFNKSDLTNLAYGKADFDVSVDSCNTTLVGMKTTIGSSNYYSSSNPDLTGAQAYLPDAEKFPFSQVQYMPDNTGRIRNQGGVGKDFQLGTGHETKYFYAHPFQEQLDRLFGSEVGDATHYQKNMVVAPNDSASKTTGIARSGQVSVSYLDQEGRVIATSLAGVAPSNLLPLLSAGAATPLTVDLFAKDKDGNSKSNNLSADGQSKEFSQTIALSSPTNLQISYNISVPAFHDDCLADNVCFNCVYDLQIEVRDLCGKLMTPTVLSPRKTGQFTKTGSTVNFLTSCNPYSYDTTFTILNLPVGTYQITKILTVNDDAIQKYLDMYMDTSSTRINNCMDTYYEILAETTANSDIDNCDENLNCAECVTNLGTLQAYIEAGGTESDYYIELNDCNAPCRPVSYYEVMRLQLRADVSPGGQYGEYMNNLGLIQTGIYPLSVLNTLNTLPKSVPSSDAHWRNPKYDIESTIQNFYFEDDGVTKSRVYLDNVTVVSNTITASTPALDPLVIFTIGVNVFLDASTNTYYTYPQYLASVTDFIELYMGNPNWSNSLVIYHPEYPILKTYREFTFPVIAGENYTSESFDAAMMSANTWADAVTAGFIKTGYGSLATNSRLEDFFTVSGTHPWDPFATHTNTIGMQNKVYSNMSIGGTFYSMMEVAAMMTRCQTGYIGSLPTSTCTTWGDNGTGPATIRDAEWLAFRDLYMAAKQELQQELALTRSLTDNNYYGYNGCIGNEDYSPFTYGFAYINFGTYPFIFGQFLNFDHPCYWGNAEKYLHKEKRFGNPLDYVDNDPSQAAYQMYLATGKCPIAFSLEQLLNETASTNVLSGPGFSMNTLATTTSLLMAMNDFAPPTGPLPSLDWAPVINTSTVLKVSITQSSVPFATFELDKVVTTYDWSDIQYFQNIHYTSIVSGLYQFTIDAKVLIGGVLTTQQLTGSTTLEIGGCTFSEVCKLNPIGKDLEKMLKTLAYMNTFSSTTTVNLTATPYSTFLTNPLLYSINPASSGATTWRYVASPPHFELTNGSSTLTLGINSVSPSTFSLSSIGSIASIDKIKAGYNNTFEIVCRDAAGNYLVTLTCDAIRTGNTAIPLSECGMPDPLLCEGIEYDTKEDLFKVLKLVLETQNAPFNLAGNSAWTPTLNSQIAGYPTTITGTTSSVSGKKLLSFAIPGGCNLVLTSINADNPSFLYDNIISVDSIKMVGSENGSGSFYDFRLVVTYAYLGVNYQRSIYGTSCFKLKECNTCTQVQTGVPGLPSPNYPSGSGSVATSQQNYDTRCEDIYEDYLSAYNTLIARMTADGCTNPTAALPLISYVDFESRNFCCESGFFEMSLFVWDVTALYMTDLSVTCSPMYRQTNPVGCEEISESTSSTYCDSMYYQYTKAVSYLNNWPGWGPAHGISLPTALQSEYCCDCFTNYAVYLNEYITDDGTEDWNHIMSIGDFCGQMNCFSDEPVTACKEKYGKYLDFVTSYNASVSSAYDVEIITTLEFNELGLCVCVDEYVSKLNLMLDGVTPLVAFPSLTDFCTTKEVSIPCIQNNPTTHFDNFEITYDDPCTEFYVSNNETNAYIEFNQQNQAFQTDLTKRYIEHCMKAVENMGATYNEAEYHFTLYYYDQAGNLIKTVPPEGVELVDLSNSVIRDSIKSDRKFGRHSVITNHRLATTYLYNSLNQLVAQNMPDQDPMQIIESTLPNGLPIALNTTAIQMVNSNLGYLTGYITNAAVPQGTRGYTFRTINGGQNWTRITNTLAANLKEIKMVSATQGFAIAQTGLFFITNDAGLNWDLVNTYGSGYIADLVAMDASATDIYILAKTGVIYKYPIAGAIGAAITTYIAAPTLPAGHTLNEYKDFVLPASIVANGTGVVYLATVTATAGSETFDVVSLNTAGASTFENVQVSDLSAVSFYNATDGVIGGLDGNLSLLKGASGSYTQRMHTSGTLATINELIMLNANIGLARVTENSVTTVRKTTDGGTTWTILDSGFAGAKMSLNKRTATTIEVLVQGSEVINTVTYSYSKTIFLNTAGIISILEQSPNVHQAMDLKVVSSYTDGGNTFYFGIDATNKLVRSNPFITMGDEVTYGQPSGSPVLAGGIVPKQLVTVKAGTGISVYVLSTTGTVYRSYAPSPGGSYSAFTALGGPTTIVVLDQMASGGYNFVVGYNTSDNRIYSAESSVSTIALVYFNTLSLTLGTSVVTNLVAHGNQISVIGTKGLIFTSGTFFFPASSGTNSITFTARQSHGLTKLIGVKKMASELLIYGENGVVLSRATAGTASACALKPMKTLEQINSVAPYTSLGNNFYLFAGDHGYLTSLNSSTWGAQAPFYSTTGMMISDQSAAIAFRDIAVSGTSIYVVGDQGTAYYNPNISLGSFIPVNSVSTDNLNSVAIVNNLTNKAIAVGNNTTVIRFNSNFSTKVNQVFGPVVNDVHFADNQIGTIAGNHYLIRSTTDGGATWKINMPGTFVAGDMDNLRKVWTRVSPVGDHFAIIGGVNYLATANVGVVTKQTFTGTISDIQFQVLTPSNGYVSFGTSLRKITLAVSGSTYTCTVAPTNVATTPVNIAAIHVFENQSVIMARSTGGYVTIYRPSNGSTLSLLVSASSTFTDIYFHDNTNGYVVGNAGIFIPLKASVLNAITREIQGLVTPVAQVLNDPSIGTNTSYNITCIAFGSRTNGVYGGLYTNSTYVTNNPAMVRVLSHEGGLYSSKFYYDRLGRIVASQNSRQLGSSTTKADDKYSYNLYDALGRVYEAGEKSENGSGVQFASVFGTSVGGSIVPSVIDDIKLATWLTNLATTTRKEVTKSYYDLTNAAISTDAAFTASTFDTKTQGKRIVHITYSAVYSASANVYDHATHYNYDIHGNVKTVYQDNRLISAISGINQHRLKRMDYVYDLISGNVHRMDYETGKADQWHHVYDYDADNRITTAFTSAQTPYTTANSSIASLQNEPFLTPFWDQDVEYGFYAHGPLARTVLGDQDVQGIDNVYTLQGWIKGVNSERLDFNSDPGHDGITTAGSPNMQVARDVSGFSLHYFAGDFKYVTTVSTANSFMGSQTSSDLVAKSKDMYSGNIARMVTSITEPNTRAVLPLGNAYRYDQLDRLRQSMSFTNLNLTTNVWGTGGTSYYRNNLTYDASGNIVTQRRDDFVNGTIDSLRYLYPLVLGKKVSNRLLYVTDIISASPPTDDIESQAANNYTYDAEGRLIGDVKEGITSITWRVDGKVSTITNTLSGRKNLRFDYDAMGHRIAKHVLSLSNVLEKSIYYILDVQGNEISVYERVVDASLQNVSFIQTDKYIYGTVRIGGNTRQVPMLGTQNNTFSMRGVRHQIGTRMYELTNHLGSVISVISNKPIPHQNSTSVDYWLADIRQSTDYSAFGVNLSARNIPKFSPGTSTPIANADGRFGYQGSEEDDEVKGIEGGSYATFYRMLDPRLGRWMSLDPVFQPNQSPYNSMDNNPICLNDVKGDATDPSAGDKKQFQKDLKALNKEAKVLSKRMAKIKGASERLSKREKRQAERFVRKNGGQLDSYEDRFGNKRYSVIRNNTSSNDAPGEIGNIDIVRKRFNVDKWTKMREERLNIKKDANTLLAAYDTRFIDYCRATCPIYDMTGISIGGDFVPGYGAGVQFNLAYMSFGKDRGFHFFMSSSQQVGFNVGAGASFFATNFNGSSKDITFDSYKGEAADVNYGGWILSYSTSESFDEKGAPVWSGHSAGVSLGGPVTFSAGVSNSFVPKIPKD